MSRRHRATREDLEAQLETAENAALTETAQVLAALIRESNVTHRELADLIAVSESRIGHMLRPNSNATIRSLSRVAHALGYKLHVSFRQIGGGHGPAGTPE